jgi:uncharacterized membrane protein YqiK
MPAVALVVLGLVCLFAPTMAQSSQALILDPFSQWLFRIFGLIFLVLGTVIGTYSKLYRRTSANQAYVRTGLGGTRVVLDDGDFVLPGVHMVVPVSLETMKLEVERRGVDALITQDNLRVDVKAEFYIKVQPNQEDILNAARSLGERSVTTTNVAPLVFEKLVSALRSVAATKDLVDIHADRKTFAAGVQEIVSNDLQMNGLTLESVTISRLDQTDPEGLSDQNIFDAQGKKKITEITAAARVERNRLEREAERAVTAQDVTTRQAVLELERQKAEVEATQARDVANIQAERNREIEQFRIQQERAVREAEIAQEQAVRAAQISQEKAIKVQEIERDMALIQQEQERQRLDIERQRAVREAEIAQQQAVQAADVAREQAIEVANRTKQIAIAEREAKRAEAETAALRAEAEKERANQQVLTVQTTAAAQREAEVKLIAARQTIEQEKLKKQTEVEVQAFADVRKAEADKQATQLQATAMQQLAEGEAQAALSRAEGEAKSKELIAGGERAQKMVDVDVQREQVGVEQARVDVERRALENRQTFDRAAIEFEQTKLRIEADKEVQIAFAKAMGEFLSRGNYNIYGDPTTMARLMEQMTRGMSVGSFADGALRSLPQPLAQLLERLAAEAVNGKAKEPAPAVGGLDGALAPETKPANAETSVTAPAGSSAPQTEPTATHRPEPRKAHPPAAPRGETNTEKD